MTLQSYFLIFSFGLIVLRAAEVSSFGRKAVKGKLLCSTIFSRIISSFICSYASFELDITHASNSDYYTSV